MRSIIAIFKRELTGYFATPVAYVFIVIFLFLTGIFTFYLGAFYERNQADLEPFFRFHLWLYLFLMPAIAMRLWSEELKTGTIELLITLPITLPQAVIGKFLAAWAFTAVALALTFPMWMTVNYLGNPDNTVILAGYFGSLLMAGSFLAIGSCISALTKNQVIAFVVSVVISFCFIMSGFPLVVDFFRGWAPQAIVNVISSFSFFTHFESIKKGVIDIRDVIYFATLICFWLYANIVAIEIKKAA
ncbi:MAG: ABC transporter permease subunit [Gammaproteobacteria bacterium]